MTIYIHVLWNYQSTCVAIYNFVVIRADSNWISVQSITLWSCIEAGPPSIQFVLTLIPSPPLPTNPRLSCLPFLLSLHPYHPHIPTEIAPPNLPPDASSVASPPPHVTNETSQWQPALTVGAALRGWNGARRHH